MLAASDFAKVSVGQISFARALTETRLFFKLLLSKSEKKFASFPFERHL